MARLLHHMSLVTPGILSSLLLLAALAPAATEADTPVKKVGMKIRQADKEEAQSLDRYAETHQPLGAGPLRMVRATPEEEHWLNRLYGDVVGESHDGKDGAGRGSGYIDLDDENPYVHALRDWVKRLTKQSLDKSVQTENPFEDL